MKKSLLSFIACLLFTTSGWAQDFHQLYTAILQDHVDDQGLVDYQALRDDNRLDTYLDQISKIDPESINDRDERIAFWLNAYNAYTLQVIRDAYPLKSINELHTGGLYLGMVKKTTIWHKDILTINGQKTNFFAIELDRLGKELKEEKAHFALVCASISCPPLRREAYEGYKLRAQLEDQARIFLTDSTKNAFNLDNKVAELSKIFDWYKADFGGSKQQTLEYIIPYAPESVATAIMTEPRKWRVRYLEYDWSLNKQP